MTHGQLHDCPTVVALAAAGEPVVDVLLAARLVSAARSLASRVGDAAMLVGIVAVGGGHGWLLAGGGCVIGPRGQLLRETAVQYAAKRLFESVGAWVYSLSQGRHTRQSAGLCDLIVLLPRSLGVVFVECKRPGARLREHQSVFADRCQQAGVGYVCCSSMETVHAYLERLGLIAHPSAG